MIYPRRVLDSVEVVPSGHESPMLPVRESHRASYRNPQGVVTEMLSDAIVEFDPGPRGRVGRVEAGVKTEAGGPVLERFGCGLNEVGLASISWTDERGAWEGRKGLVGAEVQSVPPRHLSVRLRVADEVIRVVGPIRRRACSLRVLH